MWATRWWGVGKRYYLSQNLPENEIEGYWEHTMSLSHEFALGSCRLRLQAEIINLTDEQYDVIKILSYAGPFVAADGDL